MKKTPGQPSETAPIHNVVIGTAGHIDHGKTSLIQRLTGIDADRLPEERERGMTIDLGFARYSLPSGRKIGIIDVPGHERFIKNMVAGAFGIDLVVLVVAADDGVMPQTREHLEIMKLLGLRHGLVVVTKIDLVPDDLRELVIEDVHDTVAGTFLEDAQILAVSSTTGEGFEAFQSVLIDTVNTVEPRSTDGVFRMPIQRVFSSKGFGTVITGVPVSGTALVGESLEVLPLGKTGRIRGVQAYMSDAEKAQAGQSSALNVTDLDYKDVHRGMVAATPGHFRHATMVEARLYYLPSNRSPLLHRTQIRFHCGTAEALGEICLIDSKVVEPGQSSLVQFRLEGPVVTVPGDRYIVRLHSPMVTIGGGEILDLSRWRLKRGKDFVIDTLERKERALESPREMVLNAIEEAGFEIVPKKSAAQGLGVPPERVQEIVDELLEDGSVFLSSRANAIISKRRFGDAKEKARQVAEAFFAQNERRLLMPKVVLRQAIASHDVFFQDLLRAAEDDGSIEIVRGEFLKWAFHSPKLSDTEAQFRETLNQSLKDQPLSPPRIQEVAERSGVKPELALELAALLIEEGEVVRLTEDIVLHRSAIEKARQLLLEHLEKVETVTASQAKNLLGSSRKYVIPLLELFDKEGFTIRRGDVRELRKQV